MIPLAQAVRDIFANVDPQFQAYVDRLPERVTCTKGCAACCELLALITWPEAALIAETLREQGLVERFLSKLLEQAKQSDFEGLDQESYWIRRIPCAFLGDDRLCQIYDVRPGTCRYHVAFSAPELCSIRPSGTVRQLDEGPIIAQALGPLLIEARKEAGPAMEQAGPIPIMVLAALNSLGEGIPECIAPGEWLRRYGARVRAVNREARTP